MYSLGQQPLTLRTTPFTNQSEAAVQALSYSGGIGGHPQQDRPDSTHTLVTALLYAYNVAVLGSPHDMVHLLALAEQHSLDKRYR